MTSNRSVSEMVERTLLDDVEHFLCGIDDATADGLLTRLAEARASSQAQSAPLSVALSEKASADLDRLRDAQAASVGQVHIVGSQAQSDDAVERVARAICVQDTVGNALDAVTPTEREHYYKLARAAIAAIMEAGRG